MHTRTITFDIGEEIDRELQRLARETGQDERDIARAALIEWLEDIEDTRDAMAILARNESSTSIHDLRRRLDLER